MHIADYTLTDPERSQTAKMRRSERLGVTLVGSACVLFAALLFGMIDRHAVNLLFWDQFDFLTGLREHAGQWKLFSWIHGPCRLGLGYLFIEGVYAASGWDTRFEGFATGGLSLVTLGLALVLKTRVLGPLTWLDICLPAVLLTRSQYEIFVGTPNAAHGPIPLLLVVLAPFCWLVRSAPLRAAMAGVLAFFAAFTGFAIFLVPCLVAMFAIDALWPAIPTASERAWSAAGAVLCAASIPLLLIDYRFGSAVSCYQFPHPRPLEYIPFAGLMVLRPLGLARLIPVAVLLGVVGFLLGVVGFLLASTVTAYAASRALRRERTPLSRTMFLFSAFSLLFVAATTVGRVCLGMGGALASRYVAYELPLWLASYFVLAEAIAKRPSLRLPAATGVALFVVLQIIPKDRSSLRWYSEGKSRWRSCYRATHDEVRCNRAADFKVYPVDGAPQVAQMLEYLRENRLNLFK